MKKETVYEIVKKIPKGKVTTYGAIARASDVHPRYVGYLMHVNPDPAHIPCHRVVNVKGGLAETFGFGGVRVHAERLTKEGVVIQDDRVDLETFGWIPDA